MSEPVAKIVALLTPKRRWMQFRLGTIFVVVTVLCIWLAAHTNRARKQREAVCAIKAWGGSVRYDFEEPNAPQPNWREGCRTLLGPDLTGNVVAAGLLPDREMLDRKFR
jgi:hypothetical protein